MSNDRSCIMPITFVMREGVFMQTTAYEYVFAIAKHHSISKAARELCITQPALTKY